MTARARSDRGFTLVEVLIVIVVLGMVSTVVVIATRGMRDSTSEAACLTDRNTFITAEESHYGLHGAYATEQELVDHGLLQDTSGLTDVELTDDGYELTHTGGCAGFTMAAPGDGGASGGANGDGGNDDGADPGDDAVPDDPVPTASGQPIGSFASFDYCGSGQTEWTTDFGDGNWLQETWNLDSRMSIDDYGAELFVGEPDAWAYVPAVNTNWGTGEGPAGQRDWFAVRYSTSIEVPDTCRLHLRGAGDDGYVVSVDGQREVDDWSYHSIRATRGTVWLEPGRHTVVVEWFEGAVDAVVYLEWKVDAGDDVSDAVHPTITGASGLPIGNHAEFDYCAAGQTDWTYSFGTGTWLAEYWNFPPNAARTADFGAALFQGDPDGFDYFDDVNQDWGRYRGPAGRPDYFAVRHTAAIDVAAPCTIEIVVRGDDGYAVYVDGELSANDWDDHSVNEDRATVALDAGEHIITVEYFEATVDAEISLRWRLD